MNRKHILKQLFSYPLDLPRLKTELQNFIWDSPYILSISDNNVEKTIKNILYHYDFEYIVDWANCIESREDIKISDKSNDLISTIANSCINNIHNINDIHSFIKDFYK